MSPFLSTSTSATPLFKMKFTAQQNGLLSELLSLKSHPTAIEAYNQKGEVMDIQLTFTQPIGKEFEVYQNQPNPFNEATKIGFHLPQSSTIILTLRNETGQVLQEIKMVKSAGQQEINLEGLDLPRGLIFYQLQTDFGTQTKKMLKID